MLEPQTSLCVLYIQRALAGPPPSLGGHKACHRYFFSVVTRALWYYISIRHTPFQKPNKILLKETYTNENRENAFVSKNTRAIGIVINTRKYPEPSSNTKSSPARALHAAIPPISPMRTNTTSERCTSSSTELDSTWVYSNPISSK